MSNPVQHCSDWPLFQGLVDIGMFVRSLSADQRLYFVDGRAVVDHYGSFPSSLIVVHIGGTEVVSDLTNTEVRYFLLMPLVRIFVDLALIVPDSRALLRFLVLI